MVVEQFPAFFDWLAPALLMFFGVLFVLTAVGIFAGYVVCAFRHGPSEGFYAVAQVIATGGPDLIQTSPRRVWAIARLAIQESIRRRVLLAAFALNALILLFGGWLDVKSEHPDRLYISFVMWGTQLLTLILVFLLTAFSLPNDIKDKTIHTVVTKPVRAGEIILGRVIGFSIMGTALLAIVAIISYFFVVRGISHRHEILVTDFVEVEQEDDDSSSESDKSTTRRREGFTTTNSHHRHKVTIEPDGTMYTDEVMGHTHAVTSEGEGEGENERFYVGPPQGVLQARVPIYGKIKFLDRDGAEKKRGISVGHEWKYRSYIPGGRKTKAAAIWEFEGIREGMFPNDELPLELTLGVFRTHKGEMGRGVFGEMVIKHPSRSIQSSVKIFQAKEYAIYHDTIPREIDVEEIRLGTSRKGDLFKDLVDEEGRVQIVIKCGEEGQCFGMSQADLYLRAGNKWFMTNFFKSYISLWLQMIIVVCLGVMFSTFLSTAVALMATVSYTALGFSTFVRELVSDDMIGGGPIESFYRVITQNNMMSELDKSFATTAMKSIDVVLLWIMKCATAMVPHFDKFNTSNYVSYGFNIDGDLVAMHFAIAIAFFLALYQMSYFFLKTREIAA